MLLVADVAYLRMLNLLVQVLLTAYLISLLGQQLGRGAVFSYLLAYLLLNPVSLALSFQYTSVYCITTGMSIVALRRIRCDETVGEYYLVFFLLAGILTAFFDFLTYPFVSLGIPLTIVLCLANHRGRLRTLREGLQYLLAASAAWCFGYSGMFAGKWLMSWLLSFLPPPLNEPQKDSERSDA